MTLHAPVPSYPSLLVPPSSSPTPSVASSSTSVPLTRQVSRSERMLIAALRRADHQQQQQLHSQPMIPSSSSDSDYFSRTIAYTHSGNGATSAPTAVRQSQLKQQHLTAPPTDFIAPARSPSPLPQRVVDRERSARRRTPSPSPHPYRPQSPRTITAPQLGRHQTAPGHATRPISRPGSPSRDIIYGHQASSSPVRSYTRAHSRRESGATGVSPNASSSSSKMNAHEQYLRARLEGVLAASGGNHMEGVSSATSPSKGVTGAAPSMQASRTLPPSRQGGAVGSGATVSGDQWNWNQGVSVPALHLGASVSASTSPPPPHGKLSTRSPSSSHLAIASPSRVLRANSTATAASNAMITPPPSPPYRGAPHLAHSTSPPASSTPSRAQSLARSLGHGHPSRGSSKPASTPEERLTPPPASVPFDARQASQVLKHQEGYVSFCDVAGLGEPEGMFADEKDDGHDDGDEKRGRWWEVWRK